MRCLLLQANSFRRQGIAMQELLKGLYPRTTSSNRANSVSDIKGHEKGIEQNLAAPSSNETPTQNSGGLLGISPSAGTLNIISPNSPSQVGRIRA